MPNTTRITPPDWLGREGIQQIIAAFDIAQQPLRFVGGAVRDTLRDIAVHDIDACTPATPHEVIKLLETAGIRTIPIGLDHGTVLAISGDDKIEITTLRTDKKTDGRHAEVQFGTDWKADALRRDFTMNALLLAPDGTLTDYVGGLDDLNADIIRFIGNPAKRIEEDYLRILRYARFIATTGSTHNDSDALNACKAASDKLSTLSAERIQQEMMKLLAAPDPRDALSLLENMNAAEFLFHTKQLKSPHTTHEHALLRLSLILRAQQVTSDKMALNWKLSKADSQLLGTLCTAATEPPLHLLQEHGAGVATLLAHRAHAEERYDIEAFNEVQAGWKPINFPLSGQDIMDAGIEAGKQIGETLNSLKNEWKNSDYTLTRNELLKKLNERITHQ